MSGWDEGAIFYSDQAQFPRGGNGGGGDSEQAASRHTILRKSKTAEVLASLRSRVAGETGEIGGAGDRGGADFADLLMRTRRRCDLLGHHIYQNWLRYLALQLLQSRTKAKATYVTLLCKNCKNVKTVPCRPGLGGAIVPRSCDHVPQDVPTGELPRNILLSVDRQLVQTIVPGTRLTIMGIYSIFQASNSSTSHKGAVAIRQPYIRVVGIEEANDADSRCPANFTADEIEEFKKFASEGNAYQNICSKIAPSIFGHDDVKKAVACLLFGGSRKFLPDGVKLRGDINVLLLGDPSTAKSQFLKFVEKTAPIAVYTSGKGSSAAGLTASVIRDNSSREFYLEGGAMVLADGGVVCIDEFDKMRPEDRVAIHEAMEQQTISIAKAGITTVLNSRTSVLAAANPPSGRYDDLKTAQDNIDLQTTILSRFDLIFIVKDIRLYSQDKSIASHIIKVHASAGATRGETTRVSKEDNWLKRYEPLPNVALSIYATMLQESYVKIRQDMRRQSNETGEAAVIPITVRQLEAIVRLSEALAKMTLSHVANDNHVVEAIRLFNNATMDAARSGINQHINLTPEMANEIKQAETQIKRRMGIGSHISERRLIDELGRMGLNESIVRRALLIMHQRDEVEYKRERRVVVRKA
ncbi:hypothetical protein Vadar_024731 [Vaccinium darrowii]|nr:hypothetical protein Vadar_024731 [Vaccinium darrowii]